MSVTYSADAATAQNSLGVFFKLLFRWRGSVYRLIWKDLLWFCLAYSLLSLVYRFVLGDEGKTSFESLVVCVNSRMDKFPLTFILGFFVTNIVKHRQDAFNNLPNVDALAINISIAFKGEKHLRLRKQLVRYANLAFALTMSSISPQMKKRLPTVKHFVETGLLSEEESKVVEELEKAKSTTHWLPIVWATNLLSKAQADGFVSDEKLILEVIRELNKLRTNCENLMNYDTLTIPLVYTQVVTLGVYGFGFASVIGGQFLDPSKGIENFKYDYYVPVFTLFQIIFYFGWMRVAETLINSLGEDDDDFDINAIFDRSCEVTQYIVTDMHGVCPRKTENDPYFEEELPPFPIPYTTASKALQKRAHAGSFQDYEVKKSSMKFLVKRHRSVQNDYQAVQIHNFETEEEKSRLCSPCCTSCSKDDTDYATEDLEAVSVDELAERRRRIRDKLRKRKSDYKSVS